MFLPFPASSQLIHYIFQYYKKVNFVLLIRISKSCNFLWMVWGTSRNEMYIEHHVLRRHYKRLDFSEGGTKFNSLCFPPSAFIRPKEECHCLNFKPCFCNRQNNFLTTWLVEPEQKRTAKSSCRGQSMCFWKYISLLCWHKFMAEGLPMAHQEEERLHHELCRRQPLSTKNWKPKFPDFGGKIWKIDNFGFQFLVEWQKNTICCRGMIPI